MRTLRRWVYQDGEQVEIDLPATRVVCPSCDGDGVQVNPSIDGDGLSQSDFDEDPDFRESYMRGDYDVKCGGCNGEKVVLEIDWELLTYDQKLGLARAEDEQAAHEAEVRMERRLGC